MKEERSAGMIIFYEDSQTHEREYLLLQYGAGYWDFPKGKLEAGESDREAAIREVKEETNLSIEPTGDFKQTISYFFKDRQGSLVHKTVVYFISKVKTKDGVQVSDEHLAWLWLPYRAAQQKVSYTNARQLLQLVDQHISVTTPA